MNYNTDSIGYRELTANCGEAHKLFLERIILCNSPR